MSNKTYAGIGARYTPIDQRYEMQSAARNLGRMGFTLRTGASWGADSAFEAGAGPYTIELYLPWEGFNSKKGSTVKLTEPTPDALELAAQYHPAWHNCNETAMLLHGRNSHILLGPNLDDPVRFVLCWTYAGYARGGTGQTIRLANAHNIPVFNMGSMSLDEISEQIEPLLS